MAVDGAHQIRQAIGAYLAQHFPQARIDDEKEASTGSLFFHVYDGQVHRRLEVTDTYLDGDGGIDLAIAQLTTWNVAAALREANDCLVRLMTTGVHVEPSTMP